MADVSGGKFDGDALEHFFADDLLDDRIVRSHGSTAP